MKPRILVISASSVNIAMRENEFSRDVGARVAESYSKLPGGHGTITSYMFANFGFDTVLCTSIGEDSDGKFLRDFYEKNGIDVRFMSIVPGEKTSLSVSVSDSTGSIYDITCPCASRLLCAEDVEAAFTCYPDAVYVAFDASPEAVATAVLTCRKNNIPVFVEGGPVNRGVDFSRLDGCEIFICDEDELLAYTGIAPTDAQKCLRACINLETKFEASYYVVKLGERGCFMYDGKYYKMVSAYDVDVADKMGVGDAFSVALVTDYVLGGDIKHACDFASIVGAMEISRKGCLYSFPTPEEIEMFVKENEIDIEL